MNHDLLCKSDRFKRTKMWTNDLNAKINEYKSVPSFRRCFRAILRTFINSKFGAECSGSFLFTSDICRVSCSLCCLPLAQGSSCRVGVCMFSDHRCKTILLWMIYWPFFWTTLTPWKDQTFQTWKLRWQQSYLQLCKVLREWHRWCVPASISFLIAHVQKRPTKILFNWLTYLCLS